MDIDGLKAVNDSLGHNAGDGVLKALARALRDATRQDDVLTRIGGDEFVLLAVDFRDDAQLGELAARLAANVRKVAREELEGRFSLGVSIGIATYPTRWIPSKVCLTLPTPRCMRQSVRGVLPTLSRKEANSGTSSVCIAESNLATFWTRLRRPCNRIARWRIG